MSDRKRPELTETPGDAGDEPFLSRWSRLKSKSRSADAEEQAQPAPEAESVPAAVPDSERDGEPAANEVQLPPLELLDEDSDYSAFMAAGVDEAVRRQALRKLFRSAKFNVTDLLDDYCGDYRNYAALGDIVTADMKFHAERLLKAELEKAEGELAERTGHPPKEEDSAAAQTRRVARAEGETPDEQSDADPGAEEDADEQRDT